MGLRERLGSDNERGEQERYFLHPQGRETPPKSGEYEERRKRGESIAYSWIVIPFVGSLGVAERINQRRTTIEPFKGDKRGSRRSSDGDKE